MEEDPAPPKKRKAEFFNQETKKKKADTCNPVEGWVLYSKIIFNYWEGRTTTKMYLVMLLPGKSTQTLFLAYKKGSPPPPEGTKIKIVSNEITVLIDATAPPE